ncbi:MAG: hypothetical protein IPL53_01930 [Ignavibacteria bacterium]|nr:hypothetical protein [Ignavibacteria bacterium]
MENKFVTVKDSLFCLNGNPFRFIGTNMYELANVDSGTTELMIKDAFNEGFTVIRFWAFEPMPKTKLKEICDTVSEYKIKIIPVLADTWGYLQNYKIDSNWYKDGFKKIILNMFQILSAALNTVKKFYYGN